MGLYSIYFSPTGTTKAVCHGISRGWGEPWTDIDLSLPTFDFSSCTFNENDVCIVAVPSYGGRVPKLAIERLSQMSGGCASAVVAVAYGNRHYDDTFLDLSDCLSSCGFKVFGGVAAVCEHSITREYGTDRPNDQDIKELFTFGCALKARVGVECEPLYLPGNRPLKEYGGSSIKPLTNDSCIACGLCAKACPACAIPLDSPCQTNSDLCISCMRCISLCPNNARYIHPEMLAGVSARLKEACSIPKENQLF